MATTRTRRAEELFQSAYDLDADARKRFLAEQCAGDAALHAKVEALLEHERKAPAAFLTGRRPVVPTPLLEAGERVASFEIVSLLGIGGMGAVYEARQQHPRRKVALKLIRGDRVDTDLLQRFRNEADVLATLHHPGIAQIYEAGTARIEATSLAGGSHSARIEQPFLAMELVRGEQLIEHARRRGHGPLEKAELVARVADAVKHAHQRGVIHRDLKPDNILVVAEDGGLGQPKVLDFGIARVVGGPTGETWTRVGHLIGTLEYMSPEQVSGGPRAVGTESDVYSLGVLLYELLVGQPPLRLGDVPVLEGVRRICEERPASPSRADPSIPGELEAICQKALEKDGSDRYASAGELAADLRRLLSGEPVVARSHSALYVLRKTLRRNRTATATAACALLLLIAFSVVSRVQAIRNRDMAAELAVELRAGDIERGRMMARSDNLVAAEELIWNRHIQDPDSRHSFWALWELYSIHRNLGSWPSPNGPTLRVAFHPSGTTFVTSGRDERLHLWDASGQGPTGAIEVGEPVSTFDSSPDGRTLVVGTLAGRLLTIDWATGRVVGGLDAHAGHVNMLRFSPDGELVASAGADGRVVVYDLARRKLHELTDHGCAVECVAFSEDGARLATADELGWIRLWDDLGARPVARFRDVGDRTLSLALNADGSRLASGGTEKRIRVRDVMTGTELQVLDAPNGSVRYLEFRGERTLVSGGWWWVLAWDLDTGEREAILPAGFRGIDFLESNGRVATGDEWRVRLWDQEPRDLLRITELSGRVVATTSADGELVVTGDEHGVVATWGARTGERRSSRALDDERIRTLALGPRDRMLAVGLESRALIIDLRDGTEVLELDEHHGRTVASIDFSHDGSELAHTCSQNVVHVHDSESGALLRDIEAGDTEALAVQFAPDGRLATIARDDRVRIWDRTGVEIAAPSVPGTPSRPRFSADGSRLAVTTWEASVLVFDGATFELEATLDGHRAVVWDAAFAPDDPSILATASDDGAVKLWDVDGERCLATLDDFEGWDVFTVTFGPDELLVAGGRRAALVWDLTYYERHMAANLERQLERVGEGVGAGHRTRLRAWAEGVLARPWPRF